MPPYTVNKTYNEDDFTSLSEHHARTPETFFSAQPVLHLHLPNAKITSTVAVLKEHANVFNAISTGTVSELESSSAVEIENIDVWVTSKFLALSSRSTSKSVQIEYPTISVHGQQQDSVMLELIFSDGEVMPGEDVEFATINIVPGQEAPTPSTTDNDVETSQTNGHASLSVQLFEAIGNCQELNPDPPSMVDSDEEPAIMPGEGGWITSENMDQFMDADGNFAIPTTSLGAGAGHARTADELDNGVNGEAEDDTKWRRTDHDHTE